MQSAAISDLDTTDRLLGGTDILWRLVYMTILAHTLYTLYNLQKLGAAYSSSIDGFCFT